MNKARAIKELNKRSRKADKIVSNKRKLDRFLQKAEKKLQRVPKIGNRLSRVVVLISMIKSYIIREYTEFPLSTAIWIVAALIYFVSPIDIIPDFIPGVGYIDDLAMLGFVIEALNQDILEYIAWRDNTKVHSHDE